MSRVALGAGITIAPSSLMNDALSNSRDNFQVLNLDN